jgi:predicted Zn-ribbon and HTH transcriptional regulator
VSPDIGQLSKQDRNRLARGAQVSIEVGPCPDCGHTWKANPRAEQAECPECAEYGVGADNSDTPTVTVPSWGDGE